MDKLTSLERRMDKVRPPEPLVDVVYTDGRRERMHWLTACMEAIKAHDRKNISSFVGIGETDVSLLYVFADISRKD